MGWRVGFNSLLNTRAKHLDFAGIGGRRDVDAERTVLNGHATLIDLDGVFDSSFGYVIAFVQSFSFLDFIDGNRMVIDVHHANIDGH